MSLEENKVIVRSLYEAFNRHNPALLDELMAPDFVDAPNTPFELRGLESYKRFEAMFIKGFPDYQDTIEDIIAEGDKVWYLEKGTWTDSSGKKMDATSLFILRIVNGKFVESWGPLLLQETP